MEAGHYDTVAKFDADVNSLLTTVLRENGRLSTMGGAAAQVKKVRILSYLYILY